MPPMGGFNLTVLGIESAPDAAQPPHDRVHADLPGRDAARLRRSVRLAGEGRQRQRRGLHPGLDGALRRRADRRGRWLDGRPGTIAGLVPPGSG
ncbi:hypothetical protein [Nocardioides convexus]|uniref:hypothetical protein n=1 Tax=Nocardioides convexus TaxID=2712224 RepID=UPI0024188FCD|nr:hypothetical protein [Nocardioides convexus]